MINFNVAAQVSSENKIKVDLLFSKWNKANSPGAALGIMENGKIIYSNGYGMADLEHDIFISDSTVFYMGSLSKQFVTMCILLLEEQGKLKLDDKVQKYLPDFPEYGSAITIQHFIHHTSGVRDNLTLWELAGKSILDHIDVNEMYELIKRQKSLNFAPGERYLYSNSCYFMLSLIVEKVSGMTLRSFAHQNIFKPLGMNHTFFGDDNTRIIKNRAFSYNEGMESFQNNIMRFDLVGSGGLYSNIKDMYRWDQNFYKNTLGKRSQNIINKMHQDGRLNNGQSCGYAYALQNGKYRGLKTVAHGGALAGFRSFYIRFPDEKFSVVILGNLNNLNTEQLTHNVADIMLNEKLLPPTDSKKSIETTLTKTLALDPDLVKPEQYSGLFYSEELDVVYSISVNNNGLMYSINNKAPKKLKYNGTDIFSTSESFVIKFERDSSFKISGFNLDAGRVTGLRFIRK